MNPFEMVVLIVAITAIASIYRAKHGLSKGRRGRHNVPMVAHDPDADRLREEVRTLKERVAVLERIATDQNRSVDLDREIEALRGRP